MDPEDSVKTSDTQLPKAFCSACKASLAVTGREEYGQVIISAQPCTCGDPDGIPEIVFGELDEYPEQEEQTN